MLKILSAQKYAYFILIETFSSFFQYILNVTGDWRCRIVKKTTSRFVLALSFISFLFYLTPDDSAEASSAPPVSDVTILGPGTWDRDGVGEGDSSLWPG